jgi:hypothetical protein
MNRWLYRLVFATSVLVVAVVVTPIFLASRLSHQAADSAEKSRIRADARIITQVNEYADAIVAGRAADLSDYRLDELTNARGVTIQEIVPRPALSLVVESTAAYGSGPFGISNLEGCFRLTFHQLGTSLAGYESVRLPACPTVLRAPVSSPT